MEVTQWFRKGPTGTAGLLCLQLFLLRCALAPHKVANWNFLGDPGSLPSFVAKGMSCSFYIFASWALKVDRLRSSKNSSINVSRFWNTTEKTRKSSAVGVIRKWCQMLSEVFEKQTWPRLYLDSVHSLPRLWEPVFIMILWCFFFWASNLLKRFCSRKKSS